MEKDKLNENFFSLNPLPTWIYSIENLEILDVNSTAIDHYGYTRDEFLGLTLNDLIRPAQEVSRLTSAIADTKSKNGNSYFGVFTHQKKNGSHIKMEVNGHQVDFKGHQCLLVVCQDVTKKIEQEEQIRQSEQRFKALVQEGADMICILGANGGYSYTSPTTTTILGIAPDEFIGKTIFDFVHPDDKKRVGGYLQRIRTENKVITEPFRLRNGRNEWRWIETVLTNMLLNPTVNGIVANSRDITKQKQEEQQLKLLSSVITHANDAVLITDAETVDAPGPRIIYVNEAFTKMTGYTADEVIGSSPRVLQGPNSNGEELAKLRKALINSEPCEITTINYKKDGEEFWNNFSVSPVTDENGQYTHWIAIQRDVTEQKIKELKQELLGKISLNFSSEKDLFSSSKAVCHTICDFGRFDFVELWLPNLENTRIQLIARKSASSQSNIFYQYSQEISAFKAGEGLPGAVWSEKSTLLWKDISEKDDFVRKKAAERAGIQAAMGIPMRFDDQLIGVLLVGTRRELNYLKKHVKLFEQFERYIGSKINRKKLENDLSHLYDTIPDILCVADFNGRILKINNAGCELLGYSEEELLYHTFDEFEHPEDKATSISEMIRRSEGETSFSFENRCISQRGTVIWLSWACTSAVEEGLIYATAKNITEEKKLRELNRQTRQLAKIGSWEVDLIRQSIYWSKEVHQMHETDPDSFVPDAETAIKFYREDFRSMVQTGMEKSMTTGEPVDLEAVIVTANNKEVWVRTIVNAEMVDGKCQRIYGSFQDITSRKEAELALLESEEKFRTIFDIATLGIAQVDPLNGKIILANSYYENITGYGIGELLKMSFVDLTHPEDREKDWELFSRAARGEEEYRNEKRYIRKDGIAVWVRVHVAFIRDQQGKPLKTVAICEDITDRREAETRLQNLSDNIPGVVFQYLLYPDGSDAFRYVSKGSEKIWGYSSEAVTENIDLVWDQIKAGGSFELMKESIKESVENRSQWSIRYRTITPAGEKRILHGLGTPEFLADGTVLYNSVVLDVTEESRNQELLDDVIKLTKIGSWEVNLVNKTIFWSDQVHKIYETDSATFQPSIDVAINFYREDYRHLAQTSFEQCMITGNPYNIEAVIVTAKKREVWVRTTAKAEIVDGVCTRVYGSFQDIHERKESELRLKSISDDLPGVAFQYIISPDGRDYMQGVSKAAYDVWHVSPQDCERDNNRVWEQIKKGGDLEAVQHSIQHSIKTSEQWNFQWRNILPNGEMRWHEGYGTPNELADGTVVFNSLIFDITEKYKAVELYDEASKMAKIGSWELNLINQDNTDNMYWSPMLKEILEVDHHYNPSLTAGFEFYVGESKEKVSKAVETLMETGKGFDLELEIETAKKDIKWVRCIGKAEFIDGKCHRIYGSYQDIHERKIIEIQLKTLTDNLPGAVFQYVSHPDGNNQFLYISEGSQQIWGLSPEECKLYPEKIWQQIAAGGDMDAMLASFQESAQNQTMWRSEWRNVSPDGTVRYYEGQGIPQTLTNGATLWNSLILDVTDRKVFEQNYLAAQIERIDILESISDNFYALDRQLNFTYMNSSCAEFLNVNSATIIGKNLFVEFPDLKNTAFERGLNQVQRSSQSAKFELYYPTFDAWFDEHIYATPTGFSVYFLDITEKKNAEIAVQKSNELLKNAYDERTKILESIGDAFIAVDKNWMVTYWNKEAEKILGRKREEMVGENLWEVYTDAMDSIFFRKYLKAMDTGEDVDFEEYYPLLEKWFEVSVYPSQEGLSVYFKDITLRKEADLRLTRANERFEKVTEATSDAIWDWNINDKTLYWGDGFKKLFGYDVAQNPPTVRSWKERVHPEDLRYAKESLDQVLKSKTNNWISEYRFRKEDRSYATVIDRGVVIRQADGKPMRMVGAMTDITERKNQEAQLLALNESLRIYANELERSNEELEQFAFITSHDLQEPLRMISSFMDQLKRKYGGQLDEKAHQYIHFASDGAKRMKQIILDLLDYSRAGKPDESIEKVDLNQILSEFKLLRRKIISEKSISISVSELPVIYSYRVAITQVFHSLLDNAIKYSKVGIAPHIVITATENKEEWKLAIKDNGIGIDPQFHDKIFILFQRLHNRNEFDGTGIGLSIAKKQVEFLGGKIGLESRPGEGSTFYFTLPKLPKP